MDRFLDWEFPGPWPYEASVVRRDDPMGLGRITFTIPGEVDESDWTLPVGMPAAGGYRHGALTVPPVDAVVLVFFILGDRENPRYLSGNHGEDEVPEGTAVTDDGDNVVWEDERLRVEVDSRLLTCGVRVHDRATKLAVQLELDMVTRQVSIASDIGVSITSKGKVTIAGSTVTINGRPVSPVGKPI